MNKFNPYKSCNCKGCKHASRKVKSMHKKTAHRKFRRQKIDELCVVSTGYKS